MNTDLQAAQEQGSVVAQTQQISQEPSSDIRMETENPLMCCVHKDIELTTIAAGKFIELQCYKCTQESIRNHIHNSTMYFDLKGVLASPFNSVIDRTRTSYNHYHMLQDYSQVKCVDIDEICDKFLSSCQQLIQTFKDSAKQINQEIMSFQQQINNINQEVFKICQHEEFVAQYRTILSQNNESPQKALRQLLCGQLKKINFESLEAVGQMVNSIQYKKFYPNELIHQLEISIASEINNLITTINETTGKGSASQILKKETQHQLQLVQYSLQDQNKVDSKYQSLVYMSQKEGLQFSTIINKLQNCQQNKLTILLVLQANGKNSSFGFLINKTSTLAFRDKKFELFRLLNPMTIETCYNHQPINIKFDSLFSIDKNLKYHEKMYKYYDPISGKFNNAKYSLTGVAEGNITSIEIYTY